MVTLSGAPHVKMGRGVDVDTYARKPKLDEYGIKII